jgi:ATP-dependent DNA helicase RecG
LTEGRATGIPTIQKVLSVNGSAKAKIETDEERSYFLIDIPCHPEFYKAYLLDKNRFTRERLQTCLKNYILSDKGSIEDIAGMVDVIYAMEGPQPISNLMHAAHESNRSRFRKKLLSPLLSLGLIEMTIPDKPNSRYQQYKVKDSTYELLARFEKVDK